MSGIWVLVANSSSAKIYALDQHTRELQEVADLVHTESRVHEKEITSDLPGSHGYGAEDGSRHGFEGQTGIKEHEAVNFAREINTQLETGRNQGFYSKLIIAAAPAFLGILRKNINSNTLKLVSNQIDKDLVKFSSQEVKNHLSKII